MSTLLENFLALSKTIETLLGPQGCPWDKRQTPSSLLRYLDDELSELRQAINNNDLDNTCEELGDLFYLLLLIAEIHQRNNQFTTAQVLSTITTKLIRRHPHVFENYQIKSDQELREQWLAIKAREKADKSV